MRSREGREWRGVRGGGGGGGALETIAFYSAFINPDQFHCKVQF